MRWNEVEKLTKNAQFGAGWCGWLGFLFHPRLVAGIQASVQPTFSSACGMAVCENDSGWALTRKRGSHRQRSVIHARKADHAVLPASGRASNSEIALSRRLDRIR
jgi:hypothetical protein